MASWYYICVPPPPGFGGAMTRATLYAHASPQIVYIFLAASTMYISSGLMLLHMCYPPRRFGGCHDSRYALCARVSADVNECETNTDHCDAHALCFHPIRTYNCTCMRGYTGTEEMTCADVC